MYSRLIVSSLRSALACAIFAGSLLAGPVRAQEVVQDGGFEAATAGVHDASNSWSGMPAPAPLGDSVWTITDGQGNVFNDQTLAHSGSQSLDLTFGGPQHGTVEQTLATTPGQTYTLTFFAFSDNPGNTFGATFDGIAVAGVPALLPDAGANANNTAYNMFTVTGLTATTGSAVLDFTAATTLAGGRTFLDDVSVTPVAVPEPGSIALLCSSAIAGAAFVRKRSRHA